MGSLGLKSSVSLVLVIVLSRPFGAWELDQKPITSISKKRNVSTSKYGFGKCCNSLERVIITYGFNKCDKGKA